MVSTQERFVIIPAVLVDQDQMAILTDYRYWARHEDALRTWCKDNNSDLVGMTVTFPNQKTLTAFCLKWS